MGGDLTEDLHLLDGVDAEIGLEIEVGLQHVHGVAGLFGDDGLDSCRGIGCGGCCGTLGRRCGSGRCCFYRCLFGGSDGLSSLGRGVRLDAQGVIDHFQNGVRLSGDVLEPVEVVGVVIAASLGCVLNKEEGEVGSESGGTVDAVVEFPALSP